MLRAMSLPPRVVSRTLTLSCALLASSAPLGCQQIQELTGGTKPDAAKTETPVATPGADTKVAPVVAVTPPTMVPPTAVTVDSLLAMVHAEPGFSYAIFRNPEGLLDLGDEAMKFYDGPVQALSTTIGAPAMSLGFATAKTGLVEARSKLKDAGIDLSRGVVMTQTVAGEDNTIVIAAAEKPEAVMSLLATMNASGAANTVVCKALPAAPGYVGCADNEAALTAYKPGAAAPRRAAAEAALPGVVLDDVQMLGFMAESGGGHIALAMPPGAGVLHIALPTGAGEGKDVAAVLEPGPANALRFAQPGTGFLWVRTDVAEMKRRAPELGASGQPQVDAAALAWNGEALFGGSSDPAAMQLRLGFNDMKPAADALELVGVLGKAGAVPKELPGLPGSKLTFEVVDLTLGKEATKALHLGVSGVPQAEMVTQLLGLTPDLWVFAADNSVAFAAGVNAANVARLVAPANADATLASLPAALAADLRANRVGFVMHTPVDALQGPVMLKALDAALKDVPGYQPQQVRSGLAMVAPMSSGTVWITENTGLPVVHVAFQGIGHTADEEGKAALVAAAAVATGGDPAVLFGELVTKYPGSPRLAAYQARAGTAGAGVLAGSGVAGMVLSGALTWMLLKPAEVVATPEELAAAEAAAAATAQAASEQAAAEAAAAEAARVALEAQAAAEAAKASGDAAAKKAAEDAKKKADAAKKKADAAAAKKKTESEAKQKAEADAKAKAEADAKKRAEEEAKKKAEEDAKKPADPLKVGPVRPTRVGRPK